MRFGIRLPPCEPPAAMAEMAAEAEHAGFDTAWFPDSQFLFRDVWMTLALAAERTERIALGTAVSNVETRHISVTAGALATLEAMAPGRAVFGVGTGETAVKTVGIPPTGRERMRESIATLRALLRGESVTFPGASGAFAGQAMRLHDPPARPPRIYVAATGPRMLRLAGQIADGVIVLAGAGPELVRRAVALVRESGREDVEIVLAAHTDVGADAVRRIKPMVVQSAQHGGKDALARIGIELDVPPRVAGVYPDVTHAEDWDAAVERAEQWVTDDMAARYAERYAMVGTPETVAGRLAEAQRLGVSAFYALGVESYALPRALVAAFGDRIIPRLGAIA